MNRITQEARARQRMIEYFIKKGNGTETANRYKVSRKTLYKWKKRYDGTWESLVERSRRPHHSPRAHSAEEIKQIRRLAKKYRWEDLILAYQEMVEKNGYERSYGGFKRIVRKLSAEKGNKKRKKRKNKPYRRAEYPGQKVQVDVKVVPSECMGVDEKMDHARSKLGAGLRGAGYHVSRQTDSELTTGRSRYAGCGFYRRQP